MPTETTRMRRMRSWMTQKGIHTRFSQMLSYIFAIRYRDPGVVFEMLVCRRLLSRAIPDANHKLQDTVKLKLAILPEQ